MEFKKGAGFLSYYVTEVVAESVQFLEPRNANDQQRSGGGNFGGGYSGNQGGYGGNQGGNQGQGGNSPFGQNQNLNQNQGPTRVDQDPFANDGQPIDISDDDLPF